MFAACTKILLHSKQQMMRNWVCFLLMIIVASNINAQVKPVKMKLNAGIITKKLADTKQFYTETLGFGVTFENEFYILLHTPDKKAELSFLLPDHPTQQALFKTAFDGKGVYLTIEVDNVDDWYGKLKEKKIKIEIEIRNEPWGDRHFAIKDPNGIGIDIVTYVKPE
jgi:catechol 2,3-dioxygenase-like lactoylglutathione lyase family enzyme